MRLSGLNPSMKEVKEVMSHIDTDKNGLIAFDEFVNWMSSQTKVKNANKQEDELLASFKYDNFIILRIESHAVRLLNSIF